MILGQLFRPFAFNKIKSKELRLVRVFAPLAVTGALLALYTVLPKSPEIYGDKRYLDYMLQIVGILPGFYIAALAAGATFTNPSLDEAMQGREPPSIDITKMGQTFTETLSTRLFICYLFSYLSAVSLVLAFGILLAIEVNPSVDYMANIYRETQPVVIALKCIQYGFVLLLTFYAAKITAITLHGLYFLAERMHQYND